jgi:DeoR family transcriptional regulator, fructose operon transcriptional repressor
VLAVQRHALIRDAVRTAGVIGTDELARRLEVSVETIRRDLLQLERVGALRRVHGGAAALPGPGDGSREEASFAERSASGVADKRAIGARAATLVEDGMTIVLDVGTTVLEVARALPATLRATVATCSIPVAVELATRERIEVLVSGGRLRAGDLALSDAQAVAFFADLHADIAFLGSGGVDAAAGLTDFYRDEAATRRIMIEHAARAYAVAEAGKLGAVAPHRVCDLAALTGGTTHGQVPAGRRTEIRRAGTQLLTR